MSKHRRGIATASAVFAGVNHRDMAEVRRVEMDAWRTCPKLSMLSCSFSPLFLIFQPEDMYPVAEVVKHPGYIREFGEHDIALLKVEFSKANNSITISFSWRPRWSSTTSSLQFACPLLPNRLPMMHSQLLRDSEELWWKVGSSTRNILLLQHYTVGNRKARTWEIEHNNIVFTHIYNFIPNLEDSFIRQFNRIISYERLLSQSSLWKFASKSNLMWMKHLLVLQLVLSEKQTSAGKYLRIALSFQAPVV